MVVERQSAEVALLKSRGAGLGHIMSISTLEGLLLVALAMGLGPLVAREAIAFLGYSPAFEGLTGGTRLNVELTGEVYIYAAIGAALSFIALIWPAWRSNRATVVHFARSTSRPEDKPVFQRYYLDLVVVAVGALLFFQLQESGSLVTEDLFGGLQQDPLLLIAPAVFVVTVAVLFLRLFPLVLSAFGGIARVLGGASTQMVLWHLTRAPVQPGRLALLLIMATSLGMFGGTFGATLDKSFDDRASYQSGAALRLADLRSSGASVTCSNKTSPKHPASARSPTSSARTPHSPEEPSTSPTPPSSASIPSPSLTSSGTERTSPSTMSANSSTAPPRPSSTSNRSRSPPKPPTSACGYGCPTPAE